MSEIANYPSLIDKVVLITGGASGIGETLVKNFLEQGSKVAFIDKEKNLAQKLLIKHSNFRYKALFKECDLVDILSLKKNINEIKNELGTISIVVNNAANDERHHIDDVTPEFWDNRLHVNLRHYFFTVQSTYKDMKEIGGGSIVNVGSSSWMKGSGGMPGYTTAKSAIAGLTKTLARDLGEYNIRVNCVVPGWIMTEKIMKYLSNNTDMKNDILKRQCIKRMLKPEDISKVILFFASDQSSGCTSQNYVVDGGVVT